MLANRHLPPGVDTTPSKTHFAVATVASGALIFLVKSNKFPTTVNLVRSLSSFSGFTLQNILPYVNFLSLGTCYLRMNMTAFVPFNPLKLSQFFCKGSFLNFPLWDFDHMPVFLGRYRDLKGN